MKNGEFIFKDPTECLRDHVCFYYIFEKTCYGYSLYSDRFINRMKAVGIIEKEGHRCIGISYNPIFLDLERKFNKKWRL